VSRFLQVLLLVAFMVVVPAALLSFYTASSAPEARSAPTPIPLPGVGEAVEANGWRFVVTGMERSKELQWGTVSTDTAIGEWVIVRLTVTNLGRSTASLQPSAFSLVDHEGRRYEVSLRSILAAKRFGVVELDDPMPPGVPAETMLAFDVHPEATGLRLRLGTTGRAILLSDE